MKITFLGAAKTVTGSCFLIETGKVRFLVDCGMFQGRSSEEELNMEPFPFNASELDFMLLTHAHIDHSGRIPKLYLDGFSGDILATKPTVELAGIMLPDSGHIQEFEAEWQNRKRMRAGKEPIRPLYTTQEARDSLRLFKSVPYGERIDLGGGVKVRFNDAGHILGSSIIEVWVVEGGSETKLVFSGDIGKKGMPILHDPSIIEEADVLVVESTYGNRLHKNSANKVDRFVDIINETLERGGNIIIPSFAVGRTQEIIYELNKHYEMYEGKLDRFLHVPVFVDSPLAISATEVFRNNLDCFDEEARSYIENGDNPLEFTALSFTRTADESRALNDLKESAIIISASGMCEAGRIKHHLKHNLWRQECTILFVGYQAEGTLGRRLVDGAKRVKLFGEDITVNARIEVIDGFSGHADRDELIEWINGFRKKPSRTFLVHGESEVMQEFAQTIREECGLDPLIPARGEAAIIGERPEAFKRETVPAHGYSALEIVSLIEQLKNELDDAEEFIKGDLRKGKSEAEFLELFVKLKDIEKSIVEALK